MGMGMRKINFLAQDIFYSGYERSSMDFTIDFLMKE